MAQISIFDGSKPFKIDKPVRLIELFAGIGSQAKALKRLGVDFESWYVCEFDKYAILSYNAIHNTQYPTSDVTQITAKDLNIVDIDKYIYILTYSFPCQDLSIAGQQKGMQKGSGTRSGLLWEVERLLDECEELPQVLLMENVPQVHSEDNIGDFNAWLRKLESLGYKNYYKDLNSKDFGVPQNRNRTFCVSVLGDYYYEFPDPIPLKLKLKDLLEPTVDEKYYLNDRQITYILDLKGVQIGTKWENSTKNSSLNKNIAMTIGCRSAESQRAGITNYITDNIDREITVEEIKKIINKPKLVGEFGEKKSNGGTQWYQQDRIYDSEEIAMCHPAQIPNGSYNYQVNKNENVRIRKLTPKECFRLMDFDDEDFEKARQVNSDSQLYKQAGNSIVVAVLEAIFREML